MKKKESARGEGLKLINLSKAGRGVPKSETEMEPGLKRYFLSFRNHIWKLVGVNIFFVIGNFPVLFFLFAYAGVSQKEAYLQLSDLFGNLFAHFSSAAAFTPADMSAFALEGLMQRTFVPTFLTYILYGISALTFVTFGLVNTGTAYILRNIVRGEPVFVWQDFWYAVKKNKKQGILFGILDLVVCFVPLYNIANMIPNTGNIFASMLFWGNVIVAVAWFFIRSYLYLQIVTFRLPGIKILKNATIFALVGFKRNALAFLGIVLLTALDLLLLLGTGGLLIPVAIAAPLALLIAMFAHMKVFAAYFKIKELMIDPYYAEHPEELPKKDVPEEEPVMRDDVKEKGT